MAHMKINTSYITRVMLGAIKNVNVFRPPPLSKSTYINIFNEQHCHKMKKNQFENVWEPPFFINRLP